jgi:hypothetical protein
MRSTLVFPLASLFAAAVTASSTGTARADFEAEGHVSIGVGDDQSGRGAPPPTVAPAPAPAPVYAPPPPGYGPPHYRRVVVVERDSAYTHDGMYFRFGLGGGGLAASTEGSQSSTSGTGLGLELSLGGTIDPGIVIGGTIFFQQANQSATATVDTAAGTVTSSLSYNLNFLVMGPFIEWYPNPHGGFHFGGFAGLAGVNTSSSDGSSSSSTSTGFGGGVQAGYDFWLSRQLSFGLSGRFAAGTISDSSNGSSAPSLTVSAGQLMLSLLWH